ncbi:type II toxin-antitoxin system ParD family antitoxin [Asticcacaulis solisilvae]|uniref:type II toxin-antitoxin system ParD family antitoxin n=1 Tax=Asticcacaulis solisilvae TaxID=1217274 RepID=UPI003FD791E8
MGTSVSLGDHFEGLVKRLLESGRYNNASEVVRDGLRMVEARERRMNALDRALESGLADEAAGRVKPIEEVADRLIAKYGRLADERGDA